MSPIVIVGSGLAGYGVARELRKLNKDVPLKIITADEGAAYSKPMLSNALSKNKSPDDLATADAQAMAAQLNASIQTKVQVRGIDVEVQTVTTEADCTPYSKLVLALGADPFRLDIEGDAADQIVSVNDLEDYEHFRRLLKDGARVVILGAGFIGCEFANDLANNGYHVDLLDRNALPLNTLLPSVVSEHLLTALEQLGVRWHGSNAVQSVNRQGDGYLVALQGGATLKADIVLSAIGLQPRTKLAKEVGLEVDRGIVVDRYLQTSAQNIYALGDCAEVEGHVLPFIMPLMRCTKVLAKTLLDQPAAVSYPAMPVALKTPAYPISVLPPPRGVEGEWQITQEGDVLRAKFIDDEGVLRGFVLTQSAIKEATKLATLVPALFN